MTDKEHNFVKDINVPRKEQVIIDGVKVLKEKINMCFILLLNKLETPETIEQTIYEHLDAFIKEWNTQLARKAQECEELKIKIKAYENLALHIKCPHCNKELDLILDGTEEKISLFNCYCKALEEIEEYAMCIKEFNFGYDELGIGNDIVGYADTILDIINKAKEG